MRGEQRVAGPQQRVQRQRDRGHAGRGDDAAGAALESGQRIAEQVAGRVAAAGVVVAALSPKPAKLKFDDSTSGGTTAPKAGSRSMPARTARVAGRRQGTAATGMDGLRAKAGAIQLPRSAADAFAAQQREHDHLPEARLPQELAPGAGFPWAGSRRGCPGVSGPVPQPVWMDAPSFAAVPELVNPFIRMKR